MENKILIYDDDPDILNLCRLILTAKQYEVVVRAECSEILADIAFHKPNLILMDNWMPGISGVKATQMVKSSEQFRHIPVVFFTANNNVKELAVEAGADFLLQKPFDIAELEQVIHQAIEN